MHRFFDQLGFLHIETPLLSGEAIPELHIEPFAVCAAEHDGLRSLDNLRWLQASPELHMKRLLADGFDAIYQVGRSFRRGERGRLHRPEFTIVEWYRTGDDLCAGTQLLDQLVQSTTGAGPAIRTTYAEAFRRSIGVDPHAASVQQLAAKAAQLGVSVPPGMPCDSGDDWLNLLLAVCVEPSLGRDGPEIIFDYPASQAALAAIASHNGGLALAERFELYWQGVEIANGYHELTDAAELRRRLMEVIAKRKRGGRFAVPLPESLLTAMQCGLPPCSGCALGFDRLAMVASGATSIDQMMAFPDD